MIRERPAKGARMPKNLNEEARGCRRHAEGCAQEAGAQIERKLKEGFFDLQWRWQFLARSYDPATVLSCWTASNVWQSVNDNAEDDSVSHGSAAMKLHPPSGTM
jgi:hypothetical protein